MTLTAITPDDPRAAYIEGLRALADVLEKNDKIPLPYHGSGCEIAINAFLHSDDPRAELADAARAFPVQWDKGVREGQHVDYFDLIGKLHGLSLRLTAYRESVCERIVTGTEDREVEEVVTPAVTRMVTKPVDVVEWRCAPVLAPVPAKAEGQDAA